MAVILRRLSVNASHDAKPLQTSFRNQCFELARPLALAASRIFTSTSQRVVSKRAIASAEDSDQLDERTARSGCEDPIKLRARRRARRYAREFFFLRKRFASAILQECVAGKMKEKRETDRMKP